MEKIFICQQCHAELGEDEVDGILGHAVPDYDEDGDVDGCYQCGPCEMNTNWALARIKSLKARIASLDAQLTAAQERNTAEKKRREYYQYIVYSVCNMLDQIDGRHHCIVCGTAEEPCNNVEAKIQQLTTKLDSLRQQLAAAQERERWIPASEAPPKNGPYLILFKGKVIYATFLTNGWYQGYYANSVVPDAWRELPAPPEEAADAE